MRPSPDVYSLQKHSEPRPRTEFSRWKTGHAQAYSGAILHRNVVLRRIGFVSGRKCMKLLLDRVLSTDLLQRLVEVSSLLRIILPALAQRAKDAYDVPDMRMSGFSFHWV